MSAFKSDFLNVLSQRGFIHQASDFEGLDALAAKGQATAYVGYDCTAPSLHIGNFLTMMMLYWLQQSGNKPITLMGGGTTMVGDPSGKDETRALRSIAEIEANKASIRGVFAKVLRFGNGASDEQIRIKVQEILDIEVNPAVASHGGVIELLDVKDSRVFLRMGGGCQGCGSPIPPGFRNSLGIT